MAATVKQIKLAYTLLGRAGLRGEKETLVSGFSGGRTTSMGGLSADEIRKLIEHLGGLTTGPASPHGERGGIQPAVRMRRKLISLAYTMRPGLSKAEAIGWLNDWCQQYGWGHKPLNKYSAAELPKLISQFEEVQRWYLTGLSKK